MNFNEIDKILNEEYQIKSVSAGGKCVICNSNGEIVTNIVYANSAQAKSILKNKSAVTRFKPIGKNIEDVRKHYNYPQS